MSCVRLITVNITLNITLQLRMDPCPLCLSSQPQTLHSYTQALGLSCLPIQLLKNLCPPYHQEPSTSRSASLRSLWLLSFCSSTLFMFFKTAICRCQSQRRRGRSLSPTHLCNIQAPLLLLPSPKFPILRICLSIPSFHHEGDVQFHPAGITPFPGCP